MIQITGHRKSDIKNSIPLQSSPNEQEDFGNRIELAEIFQSFGVSVQNLNAKCSVMFNGR